VAEELLRAIEQVRDRAARYRQELETSEALTRYALIDPILRALGWPLDDPSVVRPEYGAGQGKADYCLFDAGGKPAVLIGAKTLGPKLPPIAQAAVVSYAWHLNQRGNRVAHICITNGLVWELYELGDFRRPLHAVGLGKGTPAEAAVAILRALWRPLLAGEPASSPPPAVPPTRPSSSSPTATEIPLSEFRPVARSRPPAALVLPDGTEVPLRAWKDLLVKIARALVRVGTLSPQRCPVRLLGAQRRYLVHTEPVHPSGQ